MTSGRQARVFIVEDHDIVRFGLEKLVEDRYDLVGSADNVVDAVELIRERNPDVVVLDVGLPGGGGGVVVEALRRTHPDVKFLAFTVSTRRQDVIRLMRAGASGYVVKTIDRHHLIALIEQVLAGGIPISPEVAGYLLDIDDESHKEENFGLLTAREREVATYIARGYTYREGAEVMQMSVKTLETHIRHIFEKLGVTSRHELTKAAFGSGFVEPDRGASLLPTGTVTFLLTHIADSTALWNRYPSQMPRALSRHDVVLSNSVAASHGSIVRSTGDGILAVFERAGAAVTAAAVAQRALLADGFSEVGRFRVGMVVITGDADEKDGDYVGPVLDEAAALLTSCRPGKVIAASVTKDVVGGLLPAGMAWKKIKSDSEVFELMLSHPG
jgi:DNA-binding NarL/FixJ family response regulator